MQNTSSYNQGFLNRQYYTNFDPYSDTNVNDPLNQTAINNPTSLATVNRNFKMAAEAGSNGFINWSFLLKLR
jgi:hypothetical protein